MARVLFGPWEPDKPPFLSSRANAARNVYAGASGYRPMRALAAVSGGALPLPSIGASSFIAPSGNTVILAGTKAGLYRSSASGWVTLQSGFTLQGDVRWQFVQFGGLALATNGITPILKYDLTAGTTAELGGTPPKARILSTVRDFVVGGVINGDVRSLAWSGINDAEWWTFGQRQSDYQIMPTGGEVMGVFGGEVGVILQRNRICRMTYVGDNIVFQFDEISANVGCVTSNSVTQWGTLGFFLSDSGFMMWDGSALKPIGQERVDRTFASQYGRDDFARMSAAIDPVNSVVIWAMGDRFYIYNWTLDRWTEALVDTGIVFGGFSRDVSLEEVGALYPSIETMPVSLDDASFLGGDPRFYAFSTTNELATLTGATLAATLATFPLELAPGSEARISRARLLSDAPSGMRLRVRTRDVLGSGGSYTDYTMTPGQEFLTRSSGRFTVLTLLSNSGADWSYALGLDIAAVRGPAAGRPR